MKPSITIRPFEASDQEAARRLILEGLGEHFGWIDETRNPDLDDIASYYPRALFLVAETAGQLVGTGALVPDSGGSAEVIRMSVDIRYRRQGIGRAILARLLEHARGSGYRWVVLATNTGWEDANAFYLSNGFTEIGRGFGGVSFARDLGTGDGRPSRLRSWLLLLRVTWKKRGLLLGSLRNR